MTKNKWEELSKGCPWMYQDKGGQPLCSAKSFAGMFSSCTKENCAVYYFLNNLDNGLFKHSKVKKRNIGNEILLGIEEIRKLKRQRNFYLKTDNVNNTDKVVIEYASKETEKNNQRD